MIKRTGQKTSASGARSGRIPKTVEQTIAQARRLEDAGDALAAVRLLESRWVQDTESVPVLTELLQLHVSLENWHRGLELLESIPEDTARENAELCLSRMQIYLQAETGFPFLALRALREFQARFPEHPAAATERARSARLARICEDVQAEIRAQNPLPLHGDAALRFLEQHEALRVHLATGSWARALAVADQMAVAVPEWPPLHNNRSLALGMLGRNADALSAAERALAASPQNAFARRQQITQLFLLGRPDEAAQAAAQALRDDAPETAGPGARLSARVLLAQTLALLGDDAGILTLQEREAAADTRAAGPPVAHAELLWLAGNAALRRGRPDAARTLFRQAQTRLNAARNETEDAEHIRARVVASLADLSRPDGTRHGPAYLDLSLFPERDTLVALTRGQEPAVERERTRRFVAERPAVRAILAALLDRGDGPARSFAITLARMTEHPALLAALRDFVLGPHGPDAQRLEQLGLLRETGTLVEPYVRTWMKGAPTELWSFVFEVTDEPQHTHPPVVQDLADRAIAATRASRLDEAEQALLDARALAPDAPDLINNLIAVYELTERQREADALFSTLRERFPDYTFGLLQEADRHVRRGEPEDALALLRPILKKQRLHFTELAALCKVQVHALIELEKPAEARMWIDVLAEHTPTDPAVQALREMVDLVDVVHTLATVKPRRATKSRRRESDPAHR